MRRLGEIEDVSHRGMYIVRPDFAPKDGALIVDRRNREVGRVAGVLGPVSRPFVLIRPLRNGGRGADMVGLTVYLP